MIHTNGRSDGMTECITAHIDDLWVNARDTPTPTDEWSEFSPVHFLLRNRYGLGAALIWVAIPIEPL